MNHYKKQDCNVHLDIKKPACFVAGTLVHTKDGLKPIQEIKVGDLVLSKPENGEGDAEYKPVLNTFKSEEKQPIYKVEYINDSGNRRGEMFLNYILCTANHPFWVKPNTADNGKWQPAEQISNASLFAVNGDKVFTREAFTPVRTLPNFPEGYAYVQNIFDYDAIQEPQLTGIEFIEFSDDSYAYLDLADRTDRNAWKKARRDFRKEFGTLIRPPIELSINEPLKISSDKFGILVFRMIQDIYYSYQTEERFEAHSIKRGIQDGDKDTKQFITDFGDNTGLTDKSIHLSMAGYSGDCPNPYKAHVYNLEVADYHTYFVGHDGIWVISNTK